MADSLCNLVNSLEKALNLVRCLPAANSPDQVLTVCNSLRDADIQIQYFLQCQQLCPDVSVENDGNMHNIQIQEDGDLMMGDIEQQSKGRKRSASTELSPSTHFQYCERVEDPPSKDQDHSLKFDLVFQFCG